MIVKEIPLQLITLPPEMHRTVLDPVELQDLANDIRDNGLLQPAGVEPEGDHYVLRWGHRRYEAHRLLGRQNLPCNIRQPGDLARGEVLTWAENLQRAEVTAVEQARALQRMHTTGGLSIETLARKLRRSRDWVELRLALLDMPHELITLVHEGKLPISHGLTLAQVNDEGHRHHLTTYALSSGASHAVLRDWVGQWKLDLEAGRLSSAALPPLPIEGQPYVVTVPCLTCAKALPVLELRICRICAPCVGDVMAATADWRAPARGDGEPPAPLDYARS
jgi:ParB family chromosome partitioning protein